jgi:hypothetical protein
MAIGRRQQDSGQGTGDDEYDDAAGLPTAASESSAMSNGISSNGRRVDSIALRFSFFTLATCKLIVKQAPSCDALMPA